MLKKIILGVICCLTLFEFEKSFSQTLIEGELRPRFEFRDGYKTLANEGANPAFFISQRSRLSFKYNNGILRTKFTLQDVRIWGEEILKADVPSTGIKEAWAELLLCDSLSLRVGRQELVYDNERLLSRNNWQQAGTSHDAAVFKYKRKGWTIDLGAAFNQSTDNNFGTDYALKTNYKTLNYLWLTKTINNFNISIAGIADGFQKENTTNTIYLRETYGAILNYKNKNLNLTGRGFFQSGFTTKGGEVNLKYKQEKQEIAAYYANADISFKTAEKITIAAGFEYISGQDNKDLSRYSAFNTLYGTGHSFNGNIDYFTNFPSDMKNAGLFNPYLNLIFKLCDKIQLRSDFHYFAVNNNYYYKEGVKYKLSNKYLGSEADFSLKYEFSKEVSMLFGYSFMLADNSMEIIKGGDRDRFPNWAFIMITFKPVFYKSDK